jgi:hypothetical protein
MSSNLIINEQTNLRNNDCFSSSQNMNNDKVFNYSFLPPIQNANNKNSYIDATTVRGVLQSSNYDVTGNNINDSTLLRFGKNESESSRKELDTRLFPGAPLMSNGQSILKNPDLSSRLKYGEDTRSSKSANALSSYSANNFIPLVPALAENVQNVEHIIPTFYVRGGMSTRTVVRNIDYLKSCGLKK